MAWWPYRRRKPRISSKRRRIWTRPSTRCCHSSKNTGPSRKQSPSSDGSKTVGYFPAFQEAMKQHAAEIDVIVNNSQTATFENTIVTLDKSGSLLTKVSSPFYN